MKLSALSILTIFLATGAYAQTSCSTVASTVTSQTAQMRAFNTRVPPPSSTSTTDCTTAKNLKKGIDAYRTAIISNPSSGCVSVYANTVLTSGFNPQYSTLGTFVTACH
ncbi:hypothetical protein B0H14DRAFT_2726863 [Mycena olivaceomarginata]|nr:hypothetical protein B0H14DRAFT_2726863 [Mycena olivaceomarginata]